MAFNFLYEKLGTTARAWLDSYNQAHATGGPTRLFQNLTPDFKRTFAPPSFTKLLPSLANGLSVPEFEKLEGADIAAHDVYDNRILDMMADEKQRKVVLHTMRHAMYKDGRELEITQMNTLWMTEDGKRVREVLQFADSLLAREVLDEMKMEAEGRET